MRQKIILKTFAEKVKKKVDQKGQENLKKL